MSPLTEPTKLVLKKDPVLADPYYHNVSLLLHGDGSNGSTTIADSSPSPKTVTAVGNAQISTAQSKFGGSSLYFDGVSDYLEIASNVDLDLPGDFTVELWSYLNALEDNMRFVNRQIFSSSPNLELVTKADGRIAVRLNDTTADPTTTTSSGVLIANQWQHIALVRSGTATNNVRLYVDGVTALQFTRTSACNPVAPLLIGSYPGLDRTPNGYIDDLRITKGVARYTANFTPPTAPFPEVIG